MKVRKPLAALLSILLLAMSSWATTCHPADASERPCPCCPQPRPTSSEKQNVDRAREKTQIGQASAQRIESVSAWSNSLSQCTHQANSQVEFVAPTLCGVNRTQSTRARLAMVANRKTSRSFARSLCTWLGSSSANSTAVSPLSLSLRI
jgi:hypothetical protein